MEENYKSMKTNTTTHCPVVDIRRQYQKQKSAPKEKMNSHQKCICTLYIFLLITITALIVLGMYYETSKIGEWLSYLSNMIRDAVNSPNWVASYGIYFLAQLLFH